MTRSSYSSRSSVYFYILPILIILIVFAYTFISYQKDIAKDYNTNIRKYNKQTVENNKKGREMIREIQRQETAERRGIIPPEPKPQSETEQAEKTAMKDEGNAENSEQQPNLCRSSQARAKQSSLHQLLRDFGPDKAIDGSKDGSPGSTSISATQAIPGEKSWWMVDLGKDGDKTIEKIVIHSPAADHPLGSFSNFKIMLVNKDKKIVAEKDFHTDNSPAPAKETWVLDSPVEARGIRVESREPGRAVIMSEFEIYGAEAK